MYLFNTLILRDKARCVFSLGEKFGLVEPPHIVNKPRSAQRLRGLAAGRRRRAPRTRG